MVDVIIIKDADEETIKKIINNETPKEDRYDQNNPPINKNIDIEQKVDKKPKRENNWTKKEDNTLKKNYAKKDNALDFELLTSILPNRTKSAIIHRAYELRITNNHRHKSKYYKKKIKTAKPKRIIPREQIEKGLNGIREYWKFIKNQKQKYLEAGIKPKIATKYAKTDWIKYQPNKTRNLQQTTNEQTITPTKKQVNISKFPSFENVEKQFEPLIESITKHIINNKGSKLSFPNTKDILDISNSREWHNFVAEFMIKSPQIADYFNVPNKFKHIRDNEKYDTIIYEN